MLHLYRCVSDVKWRAGIIHQQQQRCLKDVLSATARLVFRLHRYDRVSDVLAILHWLRLPERRVNFILSLMAYRVQHGMATAYLNQLVPVSDLPGHRHLRSSSALELFVLSYRPTTSWPSLISCCSRNCLEHFACPCPVITIYCNLLPTAEDILVSTVISGPHSLTLLTMLPWTAIVILAMLKIFWLVDSSW